MGAGAVREPDSHFNYPRVSFLASVAATDISRQLARIEKDLQLNLTALFSPLAVLVSVSPVQAGRLRRLLASPDSTSQSRVSSSEQPSARMAGLGKDLRISANSSLHSRNSTVAMCNVELQHGDQNCSDIFSPIEEATVNSAMRQLLQSGNFGLLVNVTFPNITQSPTSQSAANAFSQALQINASSVLGTFEQGWGSVTVASVTLSYVTSIDSGFLEPASPPPMSSPTGSTDGSVGEFVGVAIAAVLGFTFFAGHTFDPNMQISNADTWMQRLIYCLYLSGLFKG